MDGKHFDDLTRALAGRSSGAVTRRFALKAAAALALGAFGLRGRAGAQVSQAQCGNKACRNNPGRCAQGCVCCVDLNGNSRCRPAGTCSPGTQVGGTTTPAPTTTSTTTATTSTSTTTTTTTSTTGTTPAPTTTTTLGPTTTSTTTTTTTRTTPPPATCGGPCNSQLNGPCPTGCVCNSPLNGTCVTATTPPPPTCSGVCNPRDGSGCATGCRCAEGVCLAR